MLRIFIIVHYVHGLDLYISVLLSAFQSVISSCLELYSMYHSITLFTFVKIHNLKINKFIGNRRLGWGAWTEMHFILIEKKETFAAFMATCTVLTDEQKHRHYRGDYKLDL